MNEIMYWLRDRPFPRTVGISRNGKIIGRKDIEDLVDLVGYLEEQEYKDCYATIFANWQVRHRKLDTVFLDIDAHNGENVDDIRIEVEKILEDNGYTYDIWFTGRGYHFYLRFPLTRIEDYNYAVKEWTKSKGLDRYIDVVGNMKQLARIPNTVNTKTGDVMKLIKQTSKLNMELGEEILSYVSVKNTSYTDKIDDVLTGIEINELPDCMLEAVRIMTETGELEHYWRVILGIFLVKTVGKEKAHEIFNLANDYEFNTTEQQLNYCSNYRCYSCKKVNVMGMCPFDKLSDCVYYIASDGWIEKLIGV